MEPVELQELKQFVADLKTDRAAQKEKEKNEAWTKYVSLTMVFLAVLTAFATLKGGGFTTRTLKEMNEATYNQALASDQWAYYQAKSIKQNLYQMELDRLQNTAGASTNSLAKVKASVDRYDKEKKEAMDNAKGLEAKRDASRKLSTSASDHSKEMGMAMTFFQVAIAIGGICLIVKKKPLWYVAIVLGTAAAVKMAMVLNTPI
jgi:uncharacterized membrane protein YoaK (UPF0700 family)